MCSCTVLLNIRVSSDQFSFEEDGVRIHLLIVKLLDEDVMFNLFLQVSKIQVLYTFRI
jgi:hypothetical protein